MLYLFTKDSFGDLHPLKNVVYILGYDGTPEQVFLPDYEIVHLQQKLMSLYQHNYENPRLDPDMNVELSGMNGDDDEVFEMPLSSIYNSYRAAKQAAHSHRVTMREAEKSESFNHDEDFSHHEDTQDQELLDLNKLLELSGLFVKRGLTQLDTYQKNHFDKDVLIKQILRQL